MFYAGSGDISKISKIGNPFEKELWKYGIERLRENTVANPEPGVVVDSINKELIEDIKQQKRSQLILSFLLSVKRLFPSDSKLPMLF